LRAFGVLFPTGPNQLRDLVSQLVDTVVQVDVGTQVQEVIVIWNMFSFKGTLEKSSNSFMFDIEVICVPASQPLDKHTDTVFNPLFQNNVEVVRI